MNRFENGQSHRFISSNSAVASDPRDKDLVDRLRDWRFAFYASTALLVLSLALSGRSDIAATAAAYIGVGGMTLSIFRMGMVLAKG
jgi:hypothetical protein